MSARSVDLVARVTSDDVVASPLGGSGAAVRLELVEQRASPGSDRVLGAIVLGDILALQADGVRYAVAARRATWRFEAEGHAPIRLDRLPGELVPLLAGANGSGALYARQTVVRRGDVVRLRAPIDANGTVRDDVAPVEIGPFVERSLGVSRGREPADPP